MKFLEDDSNGNLKTLKGLERFSFSITMSGLYITDIGVIQDHNL